MFGIDLSARLSASEWNFVCRCFQKRHLLAHKMGVVDDAYVNATNDPRTAVGRKVSIDAEEVTALIGHIRVVGEHLATELEKIV